MKLFEVYPIYDLHIKKGQGAWVYDDRGRKYLDFYGGHAVISIGHTHPHYVAAIKKQIDSLAFYSNSIKNQLQIDLAEKLGQLSGYEDYSLFLVNSGAEANENALKLASFHNDRSQVISFRHGFHGRTSAAVNVTDNAKIIAPINRGFKNIALDFGDKEGVSAALSGGNVSSIIVEGLQGIAGIYEPGADFLQFLQEQASLHGAVLILDEVQSGYGRTGNFFAHQIAKDLRPDLITVAKGMGNGFPIGGVLISPNFEARYGLLGTTFGGNHLACAAGLAVLEVIEQENLLDHARTMGRKLSTALKQMKDVVEVRGSGLMLGLEMPYVVKDLRKELLFDHKLFVGSAANANTLRLLPPLNVTEDEVNTCLEILQHALKKGKSKITAT
ncbi:MAG: aspartate aminotransferase family protein [Saprospiraceae bacterium]|nr:aspartate aminotransferase family protein [Saprospiraceae bacterium]